jgi:hypothetical protein
LKNSQARTSRRLAGLGTLMLLLGILTFPQYGMSQVPKVARPAAPARTGAVAPRSSGASASRVVTTSYEAPRGSAYWCYTNIEGAQACLNAWGGGPWVNVWKGNASLAGNFLFRTITNSSGYTELEFVGGGSWNGYCIGDAYNDSGHADTSLDPCGSSGQAAGWGTSFTEAQCDNGTGLTFHNVHWNDYLGPPANWVNGSHFYLNKPTPYCFTGLQIQ